MIKKSNKSFSYYSRSRTGGGGVDGSKKMETISGRINSKTGGGRKVERRGISADGPPTGPQDKDHRADQRGRRERGTERGGAEAAGDHPGVVDQEAGDAAEGGGAGGAGGLEAAGQVLLLYGRGAGRRG